MGCQERIAELTAELDRVGRHYRSVLDDEFAVAREIAGERDAAVQRASAEYDRGRKDALDEIANLLELHTLQGFGEVADDACEMTIKRRMERERDVVAQVRNGKP